LQNIFSVGGGKCVFIFFMGGLNCQHLKTAHEGKTPAQELCIIFFSVTFVQKRSSGI